jgi:hypothetical protein
MAGQLLIGGEIAANQFLAAASLLAGPSAVAWPRPNATAVNR